MLLSARTVQSRRKGDAVNWLHRIGTDADLRDRVTFRTLRASTVRRISRVAHQRATVWLFRARRLQDAHTPRRRALVRVLRARRRHRARRRAEITRDVLNLHANLARLALSRLRVSVRLLVRPRRSRRLRTRRPDRAERQTRGFHRVFNRLSHHLRRLLDDFSRRSRRCALRGRAVIGIHVARHELRLDDVRRRRRIGGRAGETRDGENDENGREDRSRRVAAGESHDGRSCRRQSMRAPEIRTVTW